MLYLFIYFTFSILYVNKRVPNVTAATVERYVDKHEYSKYISGGGDIKAKWGDSCNCHRSIGPWSEVVHHRLLGRKEKWGYQRHIPYLQICITNSKLQDL
jgi:hypothetical protein